MREYRSILWQTLRIHAGELRIRSLAVHRHLPETTSSGMHSHRFHQILVYLAGRGIQTVAGTEHPVGGGTLVFLPAGCRHGFQRSGTRAALCLVAEFDLAELKKSPPAVRQLASLETGRLRASLALLAKLPSVHDLQGELTRAATTIQLMQTLLAAAFPHVPSASPPVSALARRVGALLQSPDSDAMEIRQLAARLGYQPDYLGRVIKAETGLTLGQWKARERVVRAKKALRECRAVGEAAAQVGFEDQNYFARWFREQTGFTPTEWKNSAHASS
jgi:AraC family transcriptional activator of pobA